MKEKSLAALRAGIEQVIIPKLNEKDLFDLPEEAKTKLRFTLAENVDEVLAAALESGGDDGPKRIKFESSNGIGMRSGND